MANVSNQLTLEFVRPANGVVDVPGFCSEFAAKEFEEMDSRFYGPDATDAEQKLRTKQNLFFARQAGAVILRPNLEPVDMDGQPVLNPITGAVSSYQGSWYTCYGGNWSLRTVKGNPPAVVEYQAVVETQPAAGTESEASRWWIDIGKKKGRNNKGTGFAENQGVTLWTAGNMLVKNTQNSFKVHLFNYSRDNKTANNGIYFDIVSGREVSFCHYINVSTKYTYPPRDDIITQWEKFSLPTAKELYDWSSTPTVLSLFIVRDWIFLAVNGLTSHFAFQAKQFDIGQDVNGMDYPILLREGACLQIQGKGQGSIGFKKLVYDSEGQFESPLLFPGYKLNNPHGSYRAIVPAGTIVHAGGWYGGSRKLGGDMQVGPLGNTSDATGGYCECRLKGQPVDATSKTDYFTRVTEKTPTLLRFRMLDERVRKTVAGDAPAAVDSGDITNYNESFSVSRNGDYNGAKLSIDFKVISDTYSSLLETQLAMAKISITPLGGTTPVYRNIFYFNRPKFHIPDFNEINISLDGVDVVYMLQREELGIAISFDDFGYTDIELLKKLCDMAGVTLVASGAAVNLPYSTDTRNPIWYYQPKEKIWNIMQKIREKTGKLLYSDNLGRLVYKPMPTVLDEEDFAFGRQGYPITNINYGGESNFRTRIYVTGQARQNTAEYRAGDKLCGAILHKTLEQNIGKTVTEEIIDTELTTWESVESRLITEDKLFNTIDNTIDFQLTDARSYLTLWPFKIFSWTDSLYTAMNGKYLITGLSYDGDAFELSAQVSGIRLN